MLFINYRDLRKHNYEDAQSGQTIPRTWQFILGQSHRPWIVVTRSALEGTVLHLNYKQTPAPSLSDSWNKVLTTKLCCSLPALVCQMPLLRFQNNTQTHRKVRAFEHQCHACPPLPSPNRTFDNFFLSRKLGHLFNQLELAPFRFIFCNLQVPWDTRWLEGRRLTR